MILDFYLALVLKHSSKILVILALMTLVSGWHVRDFRLDASADSLVVEGDPDLEFSRVINARYGTGDFVFIVYTPEQELFSAATLSELRDLRAALAALPRVASVDSILDVPLFDVANATLSDVADNIVTLSTLGLDRNLDAARADLLGNEAFRDVLLSADGLTTALIVNFAPNPDLQELLATRSELRAAARTGELDAAGQQQLAEIEARYAARNVEAAANLHADIGAIREILASRDDTASIVMGGVPMIADDLVTFVRNDLQVFGVAMLLFIVAALAFLFARIRYVLIPLVCGLVLTVSMMGLLGVLEWPVTVISSNFISLLLIITVSLTIHLIVRYREIEDADPASAHHTRIRETLRSMLLPCFYTSLTTVVAFGSLVISAIPPIIDFGWMMVIGVTTSFVLSFLIFPALMALLPASRSTNRKHGVDITPWVGRFTERHGKAVLAASALLLVLSVAGLQRLKVENSFIEYFNEGTDIYQGMVVIDTRMGGTTPLDVIIDLGTTNPFGEGDGFGDDEFSDEFAGEDAGEGMVSDPDAYWFTSDKMARITAIHAWLDALPETGKVLSLATLLNLAYELNDDRVLSSVELGVLYNRIPQRYKDSLLRPYVSVEHDQIRFSIRVRETDAGLVRNELLGRIRDGLTNQFGLQPAQVHLTGMLVLYNNMLQSLFESQILTLSFVMALIFLMFLILFRSFKIAVLALIPNLIAALAILGLMGWLQIPLDMMTITIASISVGIGVDNTIHYVHRFMNNFGRFGNYRATMHYCHGSIGKAMYYTSFTIVAGFSILVLSNFVPTIYFGLLTSLAMLVALTGALTLLPQLLLTFRPLGRETVPKD